jgi:hypothetical protein
VGVILNVTVGKGVKVAVGGNQTVVAVGVWLGGIAVSLGTGGKGADTCKQAIKPAQQKNVSPAKIIQRTSVVYYGKSILGTYCP